MKSKEKNAMLARDSKEITLPKSSKIYLILPLLIVILTVIFSWQNRELFQSNISVAVESAIAIKSTGIRTMPDNTVIFQAAGWIEADPYTTKISSFINGIIDTVSVLDGQRIKKGDLLANLNTEELKLELKQQENRVNQKQRLLEISKSRLQQSKAVLAHLESRVSTQKAVVLTQLNLFENYEKHKDAVSQVDLDQARLAYQKSLVKEYEVRNESFQLQADVKLKKSEFKLAEDELEGARINKQRIALNLSRCEILAPVDGVIMALNIAPGNRAAQGVALMQIYDPNHLQVRVDVLFADAPALQLNQPTDIKCDALPNRKLKGVVTSIVGQADLQRNTIQAKVKILNPDALLRPDMLARVQFMPPQNEGIKESSESTGLTILIPVSALRNRNKRAADVWIVSRSSKQTESRNIKLGALHENQWIEAIDGIHPGEWVITNPPANLQPQRTVKIIKSESN